ncbi:MAG: hypothetical protein QOI74_9 [Micromonosporaceae bacterium]|jgi:uncharacterized protein (DUF305 family)|nr:hypothetical protein [Micromonosporaceae bacterium]
MRRFRLGAAVVAVTLALVCAACAGRLEHRRPASTPAAVTIAFGGTDTAWTQLMIPMTAQVVTLLELTAARAANPDLARLATQLSAGYRGELVRLRTALSHAGLTATNEHDGHDLPGMVTPADLDVIGQRTGADFDALVVANLREEMQQSIRLAGSEQRSGQNVGCRAIAASIEKNRTASLNQLNAAFRS